MVERLKREGRVEVPGGERVFKIIRLDPLEAPPGELLPGLLQHIPGEVNPRDLRLREPAEHRLQLQAGAAPDVQQGPQALAEEVRDVRVQLPPVPKVYVLVGLQALGEEGRHLLRRSVLLPGHPNLQLRQIALALFL